MVTKSGNERGIPKTPTGIAGLDHITRGGFPTGRTTLICGGAGCGKTLLGMEFLVHGAREHDEPGVFLSFEEIEAEVAANVASLGLGVPELRASGKLALEHIEAEPTQVYEAGDFDLEGLFVRIGLAIDQVGAKRVVLDTLETLFSVFENEGILRAELARLFRWLKDRGVTAVITGERGEGTLTRFGLEEYVSDCVIALDHRVEEGVTTRRMRVVKYRGTDHATNEFPFLIDEAGFSVLPATAISLEHAASEERVSTGIPDLDAMFGGGGYYRGSSVLLTGTPGTGKSTMAAHFAKATCDAGETCLYFAFEEPPQQILRNMASIGLDLAPHVEAGRLFFEAARPTFYGLEQHLARVQRLVDRHQPTAVVFDPLTALTEAGSPLDATSTVMRMVDFVKSRGVTGLFTSMAHQGQPVESTELSISSMMDTWILLRAIEHSGERNKGIYVLKARGLHHSNQIREFTITQGGIRLVDVYTGEDEVLTGTARLVREAQERSAASRRRKEVAARKRELDRKRQLTDAKIQAMKAEIQSEQEALQALLREHEEEEETYNELREQLRKRRGGLV